MHSDSQTLVRDLAVQREELARQQAEIERARQRYRELFERASVGYLILDPEGVVEDANEAALALLGHRRGELLQQELGWLVAPAHRDVWGRALGAAGGGVGASCELEMLKGDGALAAVRLEAVTLTRGRDGARLLVTVADNRARIEAARAIRESEAHYRQLFNVNPVPMLIAAREGLAVLAANPAAERACGYSVDEFRGRSLADLSFEEDCFAAWIASGHRGRAARAVQIRRGDGGATVAEVSAHDVTFDGTAAVLVVLEDITQRWHAERETRRANELLRAVIAASPMGIVCVGASGDVQIVNGAAGRIAASDDAAWVGRPFFECCPIEALAPLLLQALDGAEVPATDVAYYPSPRRASPGRGLEVRHLTVSAAPIRNVEGRVTGAIVALSDVTQRRLLEEQLRMSDKLRAIGQLAGGIAHDINNVLTVILGCATAIRDGLPPDAVVGSEVRAVIDASARAARLTRGLLTFSRQQQTDAAEVAVDTTVRDYVESVFRRTIPENIELDVQLQSRDFSVALEPSQLQQVLLNLVLNARDAMPSGGRISLRTSLDVACEPPCVCIEVEDTGVGMTPEVRARIFEPFYSTKSSERNSGLGLATVYGIVQQAEGAITVDSVPGRGTCFRIAVPSVSRTSRPTSPPPRLSVPIAGQGILVVEDEPEVRRAICRGLTRQGFKVFEADGIERAIEHATAHRDAVRVLLTDVVMPVASGIEVAREVRRIVPGVEVVFMSGYADEAFAPYGMLHEIGTILPKPFMPEEAGLRIREVLARAKAPSIYPQRVPSLSSA